MALRLLPMLLVALCTPAAAAEAQGSVDANADGRVTRDEFAAFRRARAFAHDLDGDGALSLDEFRHLIPQRVPRFLHGRAFRRVDANADGRITPDELDAMPVQAFEAADGDADGQVSGVELERLREALAVD